MIGISVDTLKDGFIQKLRDNTELMTLLNDTSLSQQEGNIYKEWVSQISSDLITYPCITVTTEGGSENRYRIGEYFRLRFDVWGDEHNRLICQKILDLIHSIINKESFIYGNIYILDAIRKYNADDFNYVNGKSQAFSIYLVNAMTV